MNTIPTKKYRSVKHPFHFNQYLSALHRFRVPQVPYYFLEGLYPVVISSPVRSVTAAFSAGMEETEVYIPGLPPGTLVQVFDPKGSSRIRHLVVTKFHSPSKFSPLRIVLNSAAYFHFFPYTCSPNYPNLPLSYQIVTYTGETFRKRTLKETIAHNALMSSLFDSL